MTKVLSIKFILSLFMIFFSVVVAQDYNPCKDKRFVSLLRKDLDDMSEREYSYFIKKEEDCTKYKMKRKRPSKSNKKWSKTGIVFEVFITPPRIWSFFKSVLLETMNFIDYD